MESRFENFEKTIAGYFPRIPAVQVCVLKDGERIYQKAFGCLDPETCLQPATTDTRFDLASVTKLFTTTAFMRMVESGKVSLDTHVMEVLPEFIGKRPIAPYEAPLLEGGFEDVSGGHLQPVNAENLTFRQLLSHSAGLPAWRPLYFTANRAAAIWTVLSTYFSYQPGERVIYSDFGLILVGLALESLSCHKLDQAIRQLVLEPLGLERTGYLPYPNPDATGLPSSPPLPSSPGEIAPTEICRWRKRRLLGEVDDENCGRLGGIAGHAGVFSTAADVATLGQSYLQPGRILKRETIIEMTREQSVEGVSIRRGIGFGLWVNDPEATTYLFSSSSFGHTGFTGTSLWIDPELKLVIALLTNEVYNGREKRVITEFRKNVYHCLLE